jgi:hypothetical protein
MDAKVGQFQCTRFGPLLLPFFSGGHLQFTCKSSI